MTAKCCRDCVFLSPQRRCMVTDKGNPRPFYSSSGGGGIIIKNPDTFYCSAFTRRNSAKKVGQTEDNAENTESTIPPIQRRFV